MKSVFDPAVREELIKRIHSLTPDSKPVWGKMNVLQMMEHNSLCDDMMLGKTHIKRVFIGRLIGGMILKKVLKNDEPFGKNSPTSPLLKPNSVSGDIGEIKGKWVNSISRYAQYDQKGLVHPFFGPMTKEQIGLFVYKHADHHLRQFGV